VKRGQKEQIEPVTDTVSNHRVREVPEKIDVPTNVGGHSKQNIDQQKGGEGDASIHD
jgi:hypothetical protein